MDMKPRVLQPGLMLLGPGVERYRISGGGATVVALRAGDAVEVVDHEGRQPCHAAAFDVDGRSDASLLGLPASPVGVFDTTLSGALSDERRVRDGLEASGIDLRGANPGMLLAEGNPAGTRATATSQVDTVCVIAAPGSDMSPTGGNPPTDLVMFVHRAALPTESELFLPRPLADPTQDFRIDKSTAMSYEVKAGDFIQIIDVEGRQCSDFQSFNSRLLQSGVEMGLDATMTRSTMGAIYPGPGLFAKFYAANLEPLVEVVQDTVGRHDTFNTACNAKYYEEMGYPGHVNCTDNMNGVLAPYGIEARRGWEAINFFYNTNVDAANQIYLDEPWSRPGDYVLLRALTDLVCVSTGCPCDVDAANGWNPTDIHVRVYDDKNMFKKATAFRMTADSELQMTKETGFHERTSALTRNMTEYEGYWLANSYTEHGAIAEYWACREAVAMIDLSPLRKYEVVGPDAELLMQTCVTRNIRKLSDGQVVYTAMCYDTGGMIDDGTVFRLGRENFRWIGGSDASGLWLRQQAQERGLRAWVKSSTSQLSNVQVQGPNSRDVLRSIIWARPDQPDMDELGWFRFAIARLGGPDGHPLVVSRTGYTGELGFEVFCHPANAAEVWSAIEEAGADHGLRPMGLEALDMLRIEAGLIFAGYEFCDQTDPYEAGIGFTVPLKSKEDDFIGRDALVRRKENPQRRLVGLEVEGGEIAVNADTVHIGRHQVGQITSGVMSPILRKNVALCRMSVEHADIGTEVEVGKLDGHQKRIPATVVRFPFYDPDKTRVRDVRD